MKYSRHPRANGSEEQPSLSPRIGRVWSTVGAVLVTAAATVGVSIVSTGPAVAATSIGICHASNSDNNPYISESPDFNSIVKNNGHGADTGPLWNPTLKDDHIKWGDIIPSFTYDDGSGPVNYPGLNYGPEGQQVLANGCSIPAAVAPGTVSVTQSVCSAGVATVPTVAFPNTAGITYSVAPAPAAGTTVTVTATADAPANKPSYWFQAPAPAGWIYVDLTHTTTSITFAAAPGCVETVVPAVPTVTESVCVGVTPSAPMLAFADLPAGVTYSVSPAGPFVPGQTVSVSATAGVGSQFVEPAPAGWVFGESNLETFAVTFAAAPTCSSAAAVVVAADPVFTDPTCENGSATGASYLVYATTGVSYFVDSKSVTGQQSAVAGSSVTVDAVAEEGFALDGPAVFSHTFSSTPACHEPAAGAVAPLATTGAPVAPVALLGALALLIGAAFTIGGTRRRRTH